MEIVNSNYIPGDSRLINQIVYELKSQGIFDQFRKECIADVDTKPAYQNLRQRVEGSVAGFLRKQVWKPDMNKNHVREMLRKNIYESGFLETGVERIVDQVVNPKINTVFLPKVEDVVYRFLGIERPCRSGNKHAGPLKINIPDDNLLPTDLEAISPESEPPQEKKMDSNNDTDDKMDDDESPPFEPLEEQCTYLPQEENSVDSHMSGFSGLVSHDSNHSLESKIVDISNQDSQLSKHSSDGHLSIVTLDENLKMEICEDSRHSKSSKSHDSNYKLDFSQGDFEKINSSLNKKTESGKTEEKHKIIEKKREKSRSSDKHSSRHDGNNFSSKDRKFDKDKKEYKERHSCSSKDHDRSKDKDSKSLSSRGDANKNSKSKNTSHNSNTDKNNTKKESSSGGSSNKIKSRSSTRKDYKLRDNTDAKSRSDSKKHDESRMHSKKIDSGFERSKKDDKRHPHSSRHTSSNRSSKERKDGKKDAKKEAKYDHCSSKDKKSDRRSTDRDSNDGHHGSSGKSSSSTNDSILLTYNQESKESQESNSNSGNGSGDSRNLDSIEAETSLRTPVTVLTSEIENNEIVIASSDTIITSSENHQFKLIKPKFASNIHEARRLMKIRKQLDKIEKQSQREYNSLLSTVADNQLNGAVKMIDTHNDKEKISRQSEIFCSENAVISKESWDAMEAELGKDVKLDYENINNESNKENNAVDCSVMDENCLYFDTCVPALATKFLEYAKEEMSRLKRKIDDGVKNIDNGNSKYQNRTIKRKLTTDEYNNNKQDSDNRLIKDDQHKYSTVTKIKKLNHPSIITQSDNFPLPLSPADSEKSLDRKSESDINNEKTKRTINRTSTLNSQRYSSEDLYKPRLLFRGSRRRPAKVTEKS